MEIIFTKNNSIVSKLIRATTREDISHCGVLLDGYVLHSNFLGLQCEKLSFFKKHSTVVYRVPISFPSPDILDKIAKLHLAPRPFFYDFGAMLFLFISLMLRNYLRIPLPKSNLWASTGMYLCTELITDIIHDREDAMLTPYKLYLSIRRN